MYSSSSSNQKTLKLYQFLNRFITKKGEPFTHTSVNDPRASYFIPPEQKDKLYELLYEAIFIHEASVHLTEKPIQFTLVKADLDFRYPIDEDINRYKYTTDNIKEIVELYNNAIRFYLDESILKPEQLKAFIFERDEKGRKDGFLTDGLHIMYPYLIVDYNIQLMIRDHVLQNCSPVLSKLNSVNRFDDIIDKSVVKSNNWFIYGCTKPSKKAYKLTHIYDYEFNDLNITKYTNDNLKLMKLLSIRDIRTDNGEKAIPMKPDREDFLEMYEEKVSGKRKKLTKKMTGNGNGSGDTGGGGEGGECGKSVVDYDYDEQYLMTRIRAETIANNSSVNLVYVKQLVSILSPERATHYRQWLEVGWCLYNISPSLLDTWTTFSKYSPKIFKDGEKCNCESMWFNMDERDGGLGIGSLHRWAKMDSPEEYKKVVSSNINIYIQKSFSMSTQDIANVVFNMYRYQYKCVDHKKKDFYEFRGHRWVLDEGGVSLYNKLGNDVLNEYMRLINHYSNVAMKADSESAENDNKNTYIENIKILTEITRKLRDCTFKEKILKECSYMFHDSNFVRSLDKNPYLLGCENGVYDLKNVEFRDGRPEDNLTYTTGLSYRVFEDDHQDIQDIIEFFSKLFRDEELREYVITLLGSMIDGFNKHEKFYILTGVGANGKSKLLELMRNSLGQYASGVPVSVFTSKRTSSSAANPEIAKLVGVRLVETTEPEDSAPFNASLIKEWTGNDPISYRPMYGNQDEFIPMFKIMLSCNQLPKLPSDDEGIWRRVIVIPFNSRFVENPNPDDPDEFVRDNNLKQRLYIWKEAFLYMLIEYYKIYKESGYKLREPAATLSETMKYRSTYDLYGDFLSECLEKEKEDIKTKLMLNDVYDRFKLWWKQTNSEKPPHRKDMKVVLEKRLGMYKASGWTGWKFKVEEEKMEEEEI